MTNEISDADNLVLLYAERLEAQHPFSPSLIGMKNSYSGRKIECAADYSMYLFDWAEHDINEGSCTRLFSKKKDEDETYKNNELFLPFKLSCFIVGMLVYQTTSLWDPGLLLDAVFTLISGAFFGFISALLIPCISAVFRKDAKPNWLAYLLLFVLVFIGFNSYRIFH